MEPESNILDGGEIRAMPFVVSFVARSGTGKTTFLEKLLPELHALGLSVGILKHHAHPTPFDTPGKDTYRLAQAGADVVVGVGAVQTAVFIQQDFSADLDAVLRRFLPDVDLVIIEGYKRGPYPKIEMHRAAHAAAEGPDAALLCSEDELLAVITDEPLPIAGRIAQFALDDFRGVAHFLFRTCSQSKPAF